MSHRMSYHVTSMSMLHVCFHLLRNCKYVTCSVVTFVSFTDIFDLSKKATLTPPRSPPSALQGCVSSTKCGLAKAKGTKQQRQRHCTRHDRGFWGSIEKELHNIHRHNAKCIQCCMCKFACALHSQCNANTCFSTTTLHAI